MNVFLFCVISFCEKGPFPQGYHSFPALKIEKNWGNSRNYQIFRELSKPCKKFEETRGDFTHVCSSLSYFYWWAVT